MQDITISTIQADIISGNQKQNLNNFRNLIMGIDTPTDVVFLPEMFNTGFSADPQKYAASPDGPVFAWLLKMAIEKNCVLAASVALKYNGKYFNSMVWMPPDGHYQTYFKRHVFYMGNESEKIEKGEKRVVIKYKGWKFLPQICYDLRFPVWGRNWYLNGEYGYDVLFYLANWPHMRNYHWKALLMARAIENQAFVVGVNRMGFDENNIRYSGDSMVVGPDGKILFQAEPDCHSVNTITLLANELVNYRKGLPFATDWDNLNDTFSC